METKKLTELPSEDAFAIFIQSTVRVPDDERTRSNSGHGYPGHTVHYLSLETFSNEEEWEKRITAYLRENVKFTACLLQPVKVSIKAEIHKEV